MAVNWGDLIKNVGGGAAWPPLSKALQAIGTPKADADTLAKEIVTGKKPIPAQLAPPSAPLFTIPWVPIIAGGIALFAVMWLLRR